jgi:hypothetical protein
MTFANLVRLNVYTTDVDELIKHFGPLTSLLGNSNSRFSSTLLGVARLPVPQLLVMLEATAAD